MAWFRVEDSRPHLAYSRGLRLREGKRDGVDLVFRVVGEYFERKFNSTFFCRDCDSGHKLPRSDLERRRLTGIFEGGGPGGDTGGGCFDRSTALNRLANSF